MSVYADTEDLEVDAACSFDLGVIGLDVLKVDAVGNVSSGFVDVDVIEEVVVHEIAVTLVVASVKAYVFVEVEGCDVLKGNDSFLIESCQLCIESERCGSCRSAEYCVGFSLEKFNVLLCCLLCDFFFCSDYDFHFVLLCTAKGGIYLD